MAITRKLLETKFKTLAAKRNDKLNKRLQSKIDALKAIQSNNNKTLEEYINASKEWDTSKLERNVNALTD